MSGGSPTRTTAESHRQTSDRRKKRPASLWWLHPRYAAILGALLLVAAYLIPETTYLTLYRSQKHVDLNFLWIGLIVYVGLFIGASFAVGTGSRPQWDDIMRYCRWVIWPLFGVVVFGYATYLVVAVVTAGGIGPFLTLINNLFFAAEFGDADYLRFEVFGTIPGITTLTQCGALYVTVEALLWLRRGSPRAASLIRISIFTSLVIPRALVVSERLALIETAIPVLVILSSWLYSRGSYRNLLRFAPLWLGLGVFILFGIGEYFRSWTFYESIYGGSYLQFASDRFLGYYATAVNNAAATYYFQPVLPLFYTLTSLFRFPVLGEYATDLHNSIFGEAREGLLFLEAYANPEFNNIAPVGLWLNEYSVFLAPVAAFVIGLVATSLYNSFLKGRLLGVLLYPSWFIGLLEISRINFWPNQRYFPSLIFLALSLIIFKLFKSPARKPPQKQPRGTESAIERT
jgi:hypothetical protein